MAPDGPYSLKEDVVGLGPIMKQRSWPTKSSMENVGTAPISGTAQRPQLQPRARVRSNKVERENQTTDFLLVNPVNLKNSQKYLYCRTYVQNSLVSSILPFELLSTYQPALAFIA